ncbi:MAG: SPOR domain-containing protein [Bacteroidaceae bacterium]|nr:SPOR domain-containing protein [Bacteroidaceae bacterium]MCF0186460.1 SPOR domain-containing protein [Bacteroidaceae bacterium]
MKKIIVLGLGLCLAFGLTSCKSSESAYRKAYEKAKAQESTVTTTEPVEVAPVVTTPVVTTPVVADNVSVRTEKVSLVGEGNLQDYSVVVGSFGVEANARGLQQRLASRGFNSMVVSANTAKGLMYRVIASSHPDKAQAAQSRAQLQGEFPDAWLLYRQ